MRFLVWFFVSIFVLIVSAKINELYTVMIIGQYFIVFGFIALSQKGAKLGSIPFLVGSACLMIPILILHPELLSVEVSWDKAIVFLFGLFSLATGLFLVFFLSFIYMIML